MKKIFQKSLFFVFILLSGCGAYFNQPFDTSKARIGEGKTNSSIITGILPVQPTVVGVYKFRDETGQYKMVESGSSFSTAITQGGTSILLKSLEDSKWFTPIERENIGNLLNERQIIRSTRQEYSKTSGENQTAGLPPLLFAGIILEGGVVSYDSNIITGGSGARYFGVGASTQYREDRITVYLRAVSTSTGRILKNVYVSKTILSQSISANLFRYVNVRRLLEVETGITKNEPTQLAVKEAIDKAVQTLIVEGIIDGLWVPQGGEPVIEKVKKEYEQEKAEEESTALYNRKLADKRGKSAVSISTGTALMNGDYPNPQFKPSISADYKFFFGKPNLNFNVGLSFFQLENKGSFKDNFISYDTNLEYNLLPFDNLSPYIYGGLGTITNLKISNPFLKMQFGMGLEYLPVNNFGIKLFGEQNMLFSDNLDGLIQGKQNDYYWRFGLGINFYFGSPYNKVKSAMFQ